MMTDEAEKLARVAHAGQRDKAGLPYIDHCERVAARVHPSLQAIGWLHDVLEDTCFTEDDLRVLFPAYVIEAVVALTHLPGETRDAYYARVLVNDAARHVKIADITDNTDPRRLLALDPEEAWRLLRKYAHALDVLCGSLV